MHLLMVMIHFLFYYPQRTADVPLSFLPRPLSDTCSDPRLRAYQRQDNQRHVSCWWDREIRLEYSRAPGSFPDVKREEDDWQPPPHCCWCRDTDLPADAVVATVLCEFVENPSPWLLETEVSHTIVTGFRMAATKENGDIAVFTAGCLHLDGLQNRWRDRACSLGLWSSWSKIHCVCKSEDTIIRTERPKETGTSRSVDGTFQIYPNPLDINKTLLAELERNPVTLFTVFFIFAVYICLVIWATIKDKADSRRTDKILVLPDSDPFHPFCYLVTVYTGSRLGSGTTAGVFIALIGQNGVSEAHRLEHPTFPILSRGAVDTFLLTTEKDLDIVSIHVWHNNCGSSPNWYLSRAKVQNVKTTESWLFLCRSWFGLGKADCKTERSFLVSNQDIPLKKMDYFLIKLAKDLEDSHVWLSVFSPVVTGPFNRVQRLSCCLAIMLSRLLFNIMFFSGEQEQLISVPLCYLKSIYIGLARALFSIPVKLTITLFRYSQERPSIHKTRDFDQRRCSLFVSESSDESDNISRNAQRPSPPNPNCSHNASVEKHTDSKTRKLIQRVFHFLIRPQFPWWCIYVSWTLVFVISTTASIFIILYSLTHGYTTSLEWFVASMTSFFKSVFLLQTLKMALFSAMSTILLKQCKHISWIDTEKYEQMKLEKTTVDGKDMRKLHLERIEVRASREYQPLEEDER